MAKRKKVVRRRRRKIGAVKSGLDIQAIGLAVGGAVAAKVISQKMSESNNATLQKIGVFIPLAAGIALPMFTKNKMIAGLAVGLVAGGGAEAIGSKGLGLIGAFNNTVAGIGYPYQMQLPASLGAKPGTPTAQSRLVPKSDWSGSRMSQMSTIGAIAAIS